MDVYNDVPGETSLESIT